MLRFISSAFSLSSISFSFLASCFRWFASCSSLCIFLISSCASMSSFSFALRSSSCLRRPSISSSFSFICSRRSFSFCNRASSSSWRFFSSSLYFFNSCSLSSCCCCRSKSFCFCWSISGFVLVSSTLFEEIFFYEGLEPAWALFAASGLLWVSLLFWIWSLSDFSILWPVSRAWSISCGTSICCYLTLTVSLFCIFNFSISYRSSLFSYLFYANTLSNSACCSLICVLNLFVIYCYESSVIFCHVSYDCLFWFVIASSLSLSFWLSCSKFSAFLRSIVRFWIYYIISRFYCCSCLSTPWSRDLLNLLSSSYLHYNSSLIEETSSLYCFASNSCFYMSFLVFKSASSFLSPSFFSCSISYLHYLRSAFTCFYVSWSIFFYSTTVFYSTLSCSFWWALIASATVFLTISLIWVLCVSSWRYQFSLDVRRSLALSCRACSRRLCWLAWFRSNPYNLTCSPLMLLISDSSWSRLVLMLDFSSIFIPLMNS